MNRPFQKIALSLSTNFFFFVNLFQLAASVDTKHQFFTPYEKTLRYESVNFRGLDADACITKFGDALLSLVYSTENYDFLFKDMCETLIAFFKLDAERINSSIKPTTDLEKYVNRTEVLFYWSFLRAIVEKLSKEANDLKNANIRFDYNRLVYENEKKVAVIYMDAYSKLYARLIATNTKALDAYPEFKTFYNRYMATTNGNDKADILLKLMEDIEYFLDQRQRMVSGTLMENKWMNIKEFNDEDYDSIDFHGLSAVACKYQFTYQLQQITSSDDNIWRLGNKLIEKFIDLFKSEIPKSTNAVLVKALRKNLVILEAGLSQHKIDFESKLIDSFVKMITNQKVPDNFEDKMIMSAYEKDIQRIKKEVENERAALYMDVYSKLYARLIATNQKIFDVYPELKTFYAEYMAAENYSGKADIYKELMRDILNYLH